MRFFHETQAAVPGGSTMWARSYTLRAVLAFGMLVAFYAVGLVLGLALLAFPVFEWVALRRLDLKLAVLALAGGGTILWSLVPRSNPWTDPGPRIDAAEHPRLFALIDEVARRMGLEVPREVFLVPEVNAFVTLRGGFLGLGGHRVMGLGVPLLAVQNVSQLKAVLAHEFGHFAGGETRLSGVLYATRAAMVRTHENLTRGGSAILKKPFEWMLVGFLRLTQAISRQQELVADEWGVRLGGKAAHQSALQLVNVHGAGFDAFLANEVAPLAHAGVTPDNVFEGYRRFTRSSFWQEAQPRILEAVQKSDAHPWDSHPALAERLAHAEAMDAPEVPLDARPAWSLLEGGAEIEERFSVALRGEGLEVVGWDALPTAWARVAEQKAHRAQARVPALCWASLAELLATPAARRAFAEAVEPGLVGYRLPDAEAAVRGVALHTLAQWATCVLLAHGWTLRTQPGEKLLLEKDGEQRVVAEWLEAVADGKTPAADLDRVAQQCGLAAETRVPVPDEVAARARARRVEVALRHEKKHAVLEAPLGPLFFPRCCAVCLGPVETDYQVTLPVKKFASEQQVQLNLCACAEHSKQLVKALTVAGYDEKTGRVTLQVPDTELAELVVRCNG